MRSRAGKVLELSTAPISFGYAGQPCYSASEVSPTLSMMMRAAAIGRSSPASNPHGRRIPGPLHGQVQLRSSALRSCRAHQAPARSGCQDVSRTATPAREGGHPLPPGALRRGETAAAVDIQRPRARHAGVVEFSVAASAGTHARMPRSTSMLTKPVRGISLLTLFIL